MTGNGAPPLDEDTIHKTVHAYYACGKKKLKAAKMLGITRSAVQHRLRSPLAQEIMRENDIVSPEPLPPEDIATNKIIDFMCDRFSQRKKYDDAAKWRRFLVDSNQPIGICWFGDPHLDDNGCNWPALKKDCSIVAKTPGMYGANIGDTTNNWAGRLARLYADQDASKDTAYKLAEWFFKESGIRWMIMLLGNHDTNSDDGARLLKEFCKNLCPMENWRAQFKLVFPNKRECLIDAAHDHKGHSQWNQLHGQQRASSMGGIAHLYIAGHRHNWAMAKHECSESGRVYWLARARGYKFLDNYAKVNGFGEQQCGSSIVSIINPAASDLNMVQCFADVEHAADYLTYLRKK